MTYQLMVRLLAAAGAQVRGVRITQLTDGVYYAAIEVEKSGETASVDFFSGSGSSYVMGKAEDTDDSDWDF